MFYKQVTHHIFDWLGKDVVNGIASYEQLQNFDYRRKITGFNFVSGVLVPLGKSNKTFIDFYLGIGVRNKSASVVGEPRSVYQQRDRIILAGDNGTFPSLPAGLRLVIGIN